MIWIWIILSVMHLLECWHEVAVIALKNPYHKDYDLRDKREHFRSAVLSGYWLAIACFICVHHYDGWWLVPALVVNRRIFFDYALMIWMDWSYKYYHGNAWWDQKLAGIFGIDGRVRELAVTLVITAGSIIKISI